MRWGLATQLGGLLALVSLLMAGLTGLYAYQASRDLLVQAAKNELMTTTQVIARRVIAVREDTSRDLQMLAKHPDSVALLQAPERSKSAEADRLATLFALLMQENPGYFQVRLISASDYGLERVRMDRNDTKLLRIEGDDLQEKSHYPYVSDTLKLPPGSTYLSRIVINHERGAHAGVDQPTVLLAAPVADAEDRVLGVVVISIDLRSAFARLSADLPREFQMYMANQQGDFLIHPDNTRTFGFDAGRRVLVQDEFPATQALVDGRVWQLVLESSDGLHAEVPVVAAFTRNKVMVHSSEDAVFLGVAQPRNSVLRRADVLGQTILQIALGLGLLGFVLALGVARLITRPLNAMSTAVADFSPERQVTGLPLQRQDEVGQLARSFDQLQQHIQIQFTELQTQREELEHLARHDVLTGLPNRRLLVDRLENALARAKRTQTPLALMFIDIDHFKKINDNWGHEAGDAALQWVALQLQANTRQTDTVARLGGDEFVVLLESPVTSDQLSVIAQKLLTSLHEPWRYNDHAYDLRLSIGISLYPENGDTADTLLGSADNAMYRVKTSSRDGFAFSDTPSAPHAG